MGKDRSIAKKDQYRIRALGDLTRGIPREKKYENSLKFALHSIMGALAVASGVLVTYRERKVESLLVKGFHTGRESLLLPEHLNTYFMRRNTPFSMRNRRVDPAVREFFGSLQNGSEGTDFVSPIKWGRELIGLVLLGPKIDGSAPARKDLDLLRVMTHYVAAEINARKTVGEIRTINTILSEQVKENERLVVSLRSVYFQTIMALAAAIDAKDPYTRGHSERVAKISREIARRIGLGEEEVTSIYMAGILHDVGKISTEREILTKISNLTEKEREMVKDHPKVSHRILSKVRFPDSGIALYALYHHEWFDGSGYPYGLGGEDIPMGARILALADSFDAMVANRPYKKGKDLKGALLEIEKCTGNQFDPLVVCAFLDVLREEIGGGVKKPVVTPLVQNGHGGVKALSYVERCLKKSRQKSSPRDS